MTHAKSIDLDRLETAPRARAEMTGADVHAGRSTTVESDQGPASSDGAPQIDAVAIPTITTERLTLRAPQLRDFDAYAAFRACPDSMAWLGGPLPRESAWHHFCALLGQWQLRGHGRFVVTMQGEDTPLALVGLFEPIDWPATELSWAVFPGCEGRGLAYEAAVAVRDCWAQQGGTPLISHVAPDNARSVALAIRLGCTAGETMRHPVYGDITRWHHPTGDAP